jgi:hypothetical protein
VSEVKREVAKLIVTVYDDGTATTETVGNAVILFAFNYDGLRMVMGQYLDPPVPIRETARHIWEEKHPPPKRKRVYSKPRSRVNQPT